MRARTDGKCSTSRSVLTKDRDRANTCVQVVGFPSDEEVMANSDDLPKTRESWGEVLSVRGLLSERRLNPATPRASDTA